MIFIISCENQERFFLIDVQENSITQCGISEIVEKITVVPLETTPECLLSHFALAKDDSLLFICSDGTIYLFGLNGKFIKKLTNKGRGPGETYVMEFELDKENKEVLVRGIDRQLIHYSYEGAVLSQTRFNHPFYSIVGFDFFNDTIYAKTAGEWIKDNNDYSFWLLMLNKKWEIRDSIRLFQPDHPFDVMSLGGSNCMSVVGNTKYIHVSSDSHDRIFRDTLYSMNGNMLRPVLRVNHGKYEYQENCEIFFKCGYPINLGTIRINSRFLLTNYITYNWQAIPAKQATPWIFYYDFETKRKYNLKNGFDDDIYQTGKITGLASVDIFNHEFYYYKFSDELSGSFPERTEVDNPVLFIVTLKSATHFLVY